MQDLARNFVPAADEVYRLQRVQDAEGALFRKVSALGHYASYGPGFTQQGTYAMTPSGVFLGSINTNDPKQMADMLRKAIECWKSLKSDSRRPSHLSSTDIKRLESKYPVGGLVLHEFERDLNRPELDGWKASAWNQDYAWFRKDEVAQLIPPDFGSKMTASIPAKIVRRFARLHLVDQVRGQSSPYAPGEIQDATLNVKCNMVVGSIAYLTLTGHARNVSGSRGVDLNLYGEAEWNRQKQDFARFDLVALGQRWGGTQNNERDDDPGPTMIGFAFTLAGDSPDERIAPAFAYAYGW